MNLQAEIKKLKTRLMKKGSVSQTDEHTGAQVVHITASSVVVYVLVCS